MDGVRDNNTENTFQRPKCNFYRNYILSGILPSAGLFSGLIVFMTARDYFIYFLILIWIAYTIIIFLKFQHGETQRVTGSQNLLLDEKSGGPQEDRHLTVNEERYLLAESAFNDGIWDWNILTHEEYFSPRWKEIVGYDDHELPNLESTCANLIHPDDKNAFAEAIRLHLEEGKLYSIELRLRHKDGTYR